MAVMKWDLSHSTPPSRRGYVGRQLPAVGLRRVDWQAQRLGPAPPDARVQVAKDTFGRMVAACGASPALFDDSDGTSKREALGQWHMGTVMPLARILSHELTMQLDTEVRLVFDAYPLDMAGRAASFAKLVSGGMSMGKAED